MTFNEYIDYFRTGELAKAAPHSFSALLGFMSGYTSAQQKASARASELGQDGKRDHDFFRVFIRRALNERHPERRYGAGQNWDSIILFEVKGDDRKAFYLFYELWDTYHQGKRKR